MQRSTVSVTLFYLGIFLGLFLCHGLEYTNRSIASFGNSDCNSGKSLRTFDSKDHAVASTVPFKASVSLGNSTWSHVQCTSDARASDPRSLIRTSTSDICRTQFTHVSRLRCFICGLGRDASNLRASSTCHLKHHSKRGCSLQRYRGCIAQRRCPASLLKGSLGSINYERTVFRSLL